MNNKTNKLSSTNTFLRKNTAMKIPLDTFAGQGILRYLEKLSPGQSRFYCRPASASQLIEYAAMGSPKSAFSHN